MISDLLIVEDNLDERSLIVETMRPHCSLIREAGSLADTLQYVHQHDPDAVMLDLILPDSHDPLQTLAAVRMSTSAAIVVVSAVGDSQLIIDGIRSGASGWYVKGDLIALPNEVIKACSHHRHEQRLNKIETEFLERKDV